MTLCHDGAAVTAQYSTLCRIAQAEFSAAEAGHKLSGGGESLGKGRKLAAAGLLLLGIKAAAACGLGAAAAGWLGEALSPGGLVSASLSLELGLPGAGAPGAEGALPGAGALPAEGTQPAEGAQPAEGGTSPRRRARRPPRPGRAARSTRRGAAHSPHDHLRRADHTQLHLARDRRRRSGGHGRAPDAAR